MNGIREISDDTECKRILMEQNRLEFTHQHPELPRIFSFWTTGDTFYLCAHYRGYNRAEDNGFMMWICDMQIVSPAQISELVRLVTEHRRDPHGQSTGWEWHRWDSNAN